jgi:hypothetical protein
MVAMYLAVLAFCIVWLFVIPFKIFAIAADVRRAADALNRAQSLPPAAQALRRAAGDPLRNQALDSLKG